MIEPADGGMCWRWNRVTMCLETALKQTRMFCLPSPTRRRLRSTLSPVLHLYRHLDAASLLCLHHRRRTAPIERIPALLLSLTSFKARLDTLHICLASLVRQGIAPDRIVLWLGEGRYEQAMAGDDAEVLRLKRFQRLGLELYARRYASNRVGSKKPA
jgi:hypothetical protein